MDLQHRTQHRIPHGPPRIRIKSRVRRARGAFRIAIVIGLLATLNERGLSGPTSTATTAPLVVTGGTRVYPGSLRGDVKLTLPGAWIDEIDPGARAGAPSTVRIFDEARTFQILLTIIPAPGGVRDFASMPRLRELADLQGKRLLMNSVETKLDTQELKPLNGAAGANTGATNVGPTSTGPANVGSANTGSGNVGGLHFTLTNKSPSPGSFEFMTNALVGVGDVMLNVTVLTHKKDAPARRAALEMLAGAQQVAPGSAAAVAASRPPAAIAPTTAAMRPPPTPSTASTRDASAPGSPAPTTQSAPQPPGDAGAPPQVSSGSPRGSGQGGGPGAGPGGFVASLPARTWAVVVDAPEFVPFEDQFSADGLSRRMFAFDPMRGISLSIHLEPAPIPTADATAARDFYLNRLRNSPVPIKDLKTGEQDDLAVLQYIVPDLNQKHVNVFMSREGVWIDVHFSALRDPGNQVDGLLDMLSKGVRVEASK